MGMVRAFAVVVLIAVAASPIVSGRLGMAADASPAYAASSQVVVQGKTERDEKRKEQNRADEDDEDERGNRQPTEEEEKEAKEQEERDDDTPRNPTNDLSLDNFQLEGHVVSLNCEVQPKEIVIQTIDGETTLYQGPREEVNRIDRLYCGDLLVGDYIFVHEAHKRNELSYDAFYISCQQEREEGPDNTNDNEDDVDPNCVHIWNH